MFTHFTKEEKTIHYPTNNRRTFIAVKSYMPVIFDITVLAAIGAAWMGERRIPF